MSGRTRSSCVCTPAPESATRLCGSTSVSEKALLRELGLEPGAESERLRKDILAGRFPLTHPPREDRPNGEEPLHAGRHNLPAATTSFVGRERELAEV